MIHAESVLLDSVPVKTILFLFADISQMFVHLVSIYRMKKRMREYFGLWSHFAINSYHVNFSLLYFIDLCVGETQKTLF